MNMSLNGQNYCLPCIINHTYLKVFTALHLTITIIMINISVTGHMWVCSLDKFILTLYDRPSPSNLPLTVKAGRNACRYLLICTQSTLRTLWLQPVSPFCLPSTQTQKIYVSLSPSLWNLLLIRSMLQKNPHWIACSSWIIRGQNMEILCFTTYSEMPMRSIVLISFCFLC